MYLEDPGINDDRQYADYNLDRNGKSIHGFDKELYEGCKKIAANMLHNCPVYYEGTLEDWIKIPLSMIEELNLEENYEGSKAAKDAVIEFINEVLPYDERVDAEILINEKLLR